MLKHMDFREIVIIYRFNPLILNDLKIKTDVYKFLQIKVLDFQVTHSYGKYKT